MSQTIYLAYGEDGADVASSLSSLFRRNGRLVFDAGAELDAGGDDVTARAAIDASEQCLFVGGLDQITKNRALLRQIGISVGAGKDVTVLMPLDDRKRSGDLDSSALRIAYFDPTELSRNRTLKIIDDDNPIFDAAAPRPEATTLEAAASSASRPMELAKTGT